MIIFKFFIDLFTVGIWFYSLQGLTIFLSIYTQQIEVKIRAIKPEFNRESAYIPLFIFSRTFTLINFSFPGLDGRWGMGMGYFSSPMSGYYHQMAPMSGMASQFMSPSTMYMGGMTGMGMRGMSGMTGMSGMRGMSGMQSNGGLNLASHSLTHSHSPFSLGE